MKYKEILIATSNNYKKGQFEYLLGDVDINLKTLEDLPFNEDPEENKETAEGNALLKARFWAKEVDIPVLADDAGLEIDALGGEPGVKARRWGGKFDDGISDEKWLKYLLERMEGVPPEERTAKFRAAWAVVLSDGTELVKNFDIPFRILEKPRDDYPSGSPISAVRFNDKYQKHEMDLPKEKQWELQKRVMEEWEEFEDLLKIKIKI